MERKLEVLLLEDNADHARLIERALRAGGIEFSARRVETRADFLRVLEEQRPDVILADFKLPRFDGRSALKLASERLPETPVIIVTGTMVDEAAVELLREGAADYILKDRLSRLAPAVRRAIDEAGVKTARREAEEKYRLLFTDAHDGVVLLDSDSGCVVDCNRQFEAQTGRKLEELLHLTVCDLGDPAQAESGRRKFSEVLAKGESGSDELELRRPGGSTLSVEFRSRVIRLSGKPYVHTISRDTSELRAAERQLRAQVAELRRFQKVTVDRELHMQELEEELRRQKAVRTA